jgi:hypothetical protein
MSTLFFGEVTFVANGSHPRPFLLDVGWQARNALPLLQTPVLRTHGETVDSPRS